MNVLEVGNRAVRRGLMALGVVSDTTTLLGHRVHFYRLGGVGNGPPLMLVHGLGSSANAFFRTLLPLSKRFSAIYALDMPGNGVSPLPASGALTVREHVDVLRAFRKDIIGSKVFLVGNSLGGGMAFYFAHHEPEALAALGVVSPAGARWTDDEMAKVRSTFDLRSNGDARAFARKLFANAPLPLLAFPGGLRAMLATPTVRRIVDEASLDDTITEAMLAGLTMPTLLLWGQQERVLPYRSIAYFREHLPKTAEVHEVPHFGHMPQMEHPRDFVQHVIRFAENKGLV
ncbi:MAG: alpha/beta hydrolase [Archangium sp.]|nr:alpha/beta hydrolase [Archangium sp.]